MLGLNPIWLGVMIAINLQTSFLTPPFGFTLFYVRGIAPPSITTGDIWIGSISWTFLQVYGLIIVWLFPGLATWLPYAIFR
jgi:TRAP-type mannitol/chloroaromatic compound transport system permease large subunit